jgi:hypothetical protein
VPCRICRRIVVLGIGDAGRGGSRLQLAVMSNTVAKLRANLDRCPVRRYTPELLDLFIGEGDATRSPIFPTMKRTNPAASVLNSVNHNVEPG